MLARFTDMTPYVTISKFLVADLTQTVTLPGVASQAAEFLKAEKELKTMHGEKFPFCKVLALAGNEKLSGQLYPDLFAVSVVYRSTLDHSFESYVVKKNPECRLSEATIREALKKQIKRKAVCQTIDKEPLKKIFLVNPEELENEQLEHDGLIAKLISEMRANLNKE